MPVPHLLDMAGKETWERRDLPLCLCACSGDLPPISSKRVESIEPIVGRFVDAACQEDEAHEPFFPTLLPAPALPCLPCLPCPALPCPALPCPALPCPALPSTLLGLAWVGCGLHWVLSDMRFCRILYSCFSLTVVPCFGVDPAGVAWVRSWAFASTSFCFTLSPHKPADVSGFRRQSARRGKNPKSLNAYILNPNAKGPNRAPSNTVFLFSREIQIPKRIANKLSTLDFPDLSSRRDSVPKF